MSEHRIIKRMAVAAGTGLLALSGAGVAQADVGTDIANLVRATVPGSVASTGVIVAQTNVVRAQAGVAPLSVSNDTGAQKWANYMASTGDFSHDSTQSVGENRVFAENIYYRGAADGVLHAVDSWTNSPGHYANMVNPAYHSMSVGSAVSADGGSYVVQRFYF